MSVTFTKLNWFSNFRAKRSNFYKSKEGPSGRDLRYGRKVRATNLKVMVFTHWPKTMMYGRINDARIKMGKLVILYKI